MPVEQILDKIVIFITVLMPVCFLLVFLVLLRVLRMLRAHTDMLMYYGRQIEDVRKMAAGLQSAQRKPEIPDDDAGLYEVLNE
jgi:hypothetical protein